MLNQLPLTSREDYKNFILYIEQNYPVNAWKVNDIHLWPILRIYLFFYLIDVVEKGKTFTAPPDKTLVIESYPTLKIIKEKLIFNKFLATIPKKKTVFCGADIHRVDYKGFRFNRFFDSLAKIDTSVDNYIFLEYFYDYKKNYYNPENILPTEHRIERFTHTYKYTCDVKLNGFEEFLQDLRNNPITNAFTSLYSINRVKTLGTRVTYYTNFYKKILSRIKPSQQYILCYYNSVSTFAMVAAANQLGIKTIEMQHGPQPDLHLSYTNWSNVPTEGYDVLPRNFYQWDQDSADNVDTWATKTKLYKTKVVGHPWIQYLDKEDLPVEDDNFILYCLQPEPVKLTDQFNDNIIKAIKESQKKWYIRLHPRQMPALDDVLQLIKKHKLEEFVNVNDATALPLPILIKKANVVVTHSSGSATEAEMLGTKVILTNPLGVQYHQGIIDRGNAIFLNADTPEFSYELKKETME